MPARCKFSNKDSVSLKYGAIYWTADRIKIKKKRVHIFIKIYATLGDIAVFHRSCHLLKSILDSSWNVTAHGDAREGKWRRKWRMEWVASTLHTTSEHGVYSITIADAHTSAASSWLNWRPRQFKWTRPFRRKTKYGFCACANTFQLLSASVEMYRVG